MIVSPWAPPKGIGGYEFITDARGASQIKSNWEKLLSEDSMGVISSQPQKIVSILGDLQKVSYSKYFWLAISSLRLRTSASIS